MTQPFPWETLRTIIGGNSGLDVQRLHLQNRADACDFLRSYGFDWNREPHRNEVQNLREQALSFIESELAGSVDIVVPRFLYATDPRDLLLIASQKGADKKQLWACATLRVMHTLAHCDTYFNTHFGPEIRSQILAAFIPHLFGSPHDGGLMMGRGEDAIPLADFVIKHTKPKHSVVMKLLHKVENVASDVFDRVGLRFITRERFDTLLLVRFLRAHNIIMFANIKPSRSRNTLVDLDWLESALEELTLDTELPMPEKLARMREVARTGPAPKVEYNPANPFSSHNYRAIQFTCRQLIRVDNPISPELKQIFKAAERRLGEDDPTVRDLGAQIRKTKQQIRFFFPFEIQIMDEATYLESQSGLASHEEYKRRQRDSVIQRVLGPLLDARDRGEIPHMDTYDEVIRAMTEPHAAEPDLP